MSLGPGVHLYITAEGETYNKGYKKENACDILYSIYLIVFNLF